MFYHKKEMQKKLLWNYLKIYNLPKNSISRIKKLSRSAYGNNFSEHLQMETDLMVKSMGDKESIEGIDAFLEKREPDYKKLRM